ncbi:protein HEXIM1 [Octodon degus]|uniref:Protein HEXIM1 n=1 Tax=Octodon degus TaxID=10160 RepID=A0A6P3FB04_OCTDE|nr:protein HEXIM1 [Octodon degus]
MAELLPSELPPAGNPGAGAGDPGPARPPAAPEGDGRWRSRASPPGGAGSPAPQQDAGDGGPSGPGGGDERSPELPAPPGPDAEAPRTAWGSQQRQLGKKKHRRRPSKKKRHWKPYYKLSWEEKRKFDERQSLRASRVRAEMFAKGQPVAPYNTTQFLMDDHDQEEPDLKTGLCPRRAAKSDSSEEDFMEEAGEEDGGSDGMGGDGGEFLQRDFSETYERYHAESLQNMSKQELIREYLELEKCLSRMEDENNRLRLESRRPGGDEARVRELELELDRLRAENLQLLRQSERPRAPEQD